MFGDNDQMEHPGRDSMTEAQKQAHKEILWKMRTGQGRTVISWQERPSKSAVEQFRHKPYGDLVIEREDDDAGTVQ